MIVFKNILVPFDGSDAARRALDAAIGVAADDALVTILQAADQPLAGNPTTVVAERMAGVVRSEEEVKQEAAQYWVTIEERLASIAEEATAETGKHVKTCCVVLEGSPVSVITDYARNNDIDIIVMGRRGLGSVRAAFGSVSQRVAHEIDLPLLLVK